MVESVMAYQVEGRLKRLILVLLLAALYAIILCSCGTNGAQNVDTAKSLPLVDSRPESPQQASQALAQGKLYEAGKINVVVLQGTYEEMGRQYGALLKHVLNRIYDGVVEGLQQIPGLSLEDLQEQAEDLAQLDGFFASILPDLAYIINAADPESACSYEWSTSEVKRRGPDEDGLLVATNFFFDPAWGELPHGEDPDYSVQRRDNLLALGEKYEGQIDPR